MWIERQIEPLLRRRAATRPIVVLTGARQTGKTSLMKRLFPDYNYVSLDLPSEAEQAQEDPTTFIYRHPPPVIIDEVQYAPELFRYLKIEVDKNRESGSFLLIGSQPFTLMRSVSESLAGRADIVELEPLSFSEVKQSNSDLSINEYLLMGGYPELHANRDIDPVGFMESYVATYLERDLRKLLDIVNMSNYERFLRACALRTAQLLNKSDFARGVGIAVSTASAWLSAMETTHQLAFLESWFGNATVSLVKRPKLFLRDVGLATFLCGIHDMKGLLTSPLLGALWETLVCSEIRRSQINHRGNWSLYFWRDRSREADFLLHRGGIFHLADSKWSESPRSRDAESLRKVAQVLPPSSVESMSVFCRAMNTYPITNDVSAVPLTEIGKEWLA